MRQLSHYICDGCRRPAAGDQEGIALKKDLPELSRFELQCLRRLWARGEASVREIHEDLPDAPSYSTVRKIFERLEAKGAVERVRLEGRAWIYRSTVASSAMIRKEVRRLIDGLFDGRGDALVAHLADTNAISLEDLKEIENQLRNENRRRQDTDPPARRGGDRGSQDGRSLVKQRGAARPQDADSPVPREGRAS